MKKLLYAAPLALALALAGCSDDSSNSQSAETVEETATAKEDTIQSNIADYGTVTDIYFNNTVELQKKFSAIDMKINDIQVFDLDVEEAYENQMTYRQDISHIIVLKFDVTNTTKRDIGFSPEQDSRIVVDGEQGEAGYFDAPSSIAPGATVSYELHYEFKKPLNNVDTFDLYLEPAYDTETSEDIGKGVKWTIKLNK